MTVSKVLFVTKLIELWSVHTKLQKWCSRFYTLQKFHTDVYYWWQQSSVSSVKRLKSGKWREGGGESFHFTFCILENTTVINFELKKNSGNCLFCNLHMRYNSEKISLCVRRKKCATFEKTNAVVNNLPRRT